VTSWWRRLLRVLGQDRIRLPKRPLAPPDIHPGHRLQIGDELWRVGAIKPPASDATEAFLLLAVRASTATAVLFAPATAAGAAWSPWTLIKGRDRLEVPAEMIVVFPSGSTDDDAG
jgi:hypothetical protein